MIAQVRIARPTASIENVLRFYHEALGLRIIARFADHNGYDGVMLALPDRADHLEFTSHGDIGPCTAPSADNLLVLYVPDDAEFRERCGRMRDHGYAPVEPENPYWLARGAVTFADPEGWRVVFFPGPGLSVSSNGV